MDRVPGLTAAVDTGPLFGDDNPKTSSQSNEGASQMTQVRDHRHSSNLVPSTDDLDQELERHPPYRTHTEEAKEDRADTIKQTDFRPREYQRVEDNDPADGAACADKRHISSGIQEAVAQQRRQVGNYQEKRKTEPPKPVFCVIAEDDQKIDVAYDMHGSAVKQK